jgi:hypothetical protein
MTNQEDLNDVQVFYALINSSTVGLFINLSTRVWWVCVTTRGLVGLWTSAGWCH